MNLDPYEELGIPRDATVREARKAYRKRSQKTHPNNQDGGSAEAFARTSTALAVIVDPRRRKHFDETDRVDEDRVDNDHAAALQVIERFFGSLINDACGGVKMEDPRKRDLVAEFKAKMAQEVAEALANKAQGATVMAFLVDMARRFKAPEGRPNPVKRSIERKIGDLEGQMRDLDEGVAARTLALKLVAEIVFERDHPAPPPEFVEVEANGTRVIFRQMSL